MEKKTATANDGTLGSVDVSGVYKILNKYRADSLSEAEKGTKFEELMRFYLLELPKYKGRMS